MYLLSMVSIELLLPMIIYSDVFSDQTFAVVEDCLRKADGGTPLSNSNNASFTASDLTCGTALERKYTAAERTAQCSP